MRADRSAHRVVVSSSIPASTDAVWARVTTPEGINHELGPLLKMTVPPGARGVTLDGVRLGEKLGRSWVLLFGVLPVDYDDICLVEVERGRRFLERSQLLSMAAWEHERVVEPSNGASTVTDRLSFTFRRPLGFVPGAASLARAIVRALFRHRHRRLASHFAGGLAA